MSRTYFFLLFSTFLLATPVASSHAQDTAGLPVERASGEALASATGHYARSRSLLIAAIREFDRGLAIADPSALLDVERFRATLIDRSAELERILAPQPRVSEGGVRFTPDSRLLGEAE